MCFSNNLKESFIKASIYSCIKVGYMKTNKEETKISCVTGNYVQYDQLQNSENMVRLLVKRCCVTNYLKFHTVHNFNPITLLYPITTIQMYSLSHWSYFYHPRYFVWKYVYRRWTNTLAVKRAKTSPWTLWWYEFFFIRTSEIVISKCNIRLKVL